MKKVFYGLLAVVVVFALVLSGCTKPTPTPTAPGATTTPATTPVAKPIEFIFSYPHPATHAGWTAIFGPWIKEMETRTNGRVHFTPYFAEALGKAADEYDMVIKGIADIAHFPVGYATGRFPITEITGLPIPVESAEQSTFALKAVYDAGLMDKEHFAVHVAACGATTPTKMWSKQKISTLDDIKGKKFRVMGKTIADGITALGGVPVALPMPEIYTSLDKGVIDGGCYDFLSSSAYKFFEAANYVVELKAFTVSFTLNVNKAKYDSLPADVKAIWDQVEEEQWIPMFANQDVSEVAGKKVCLDGGTVITDLSAADRAKMTELWAPVVSKWVQDTTKLGYEAQKAADTYAAASKQYAASPDIQKKYGPSLK